MTPVKVKVGGIYKKKVKMALQNPGVADHRFSIWASNFKNFWSYGLLKFTQFTLSVG
jgi:hypothetical protein